LSLLLNKDFEGRVLVRPFERFDFYYRMHNMKNNECQRCGMMPLEKPEDFGTTADGSRSEDYCCLCYENGAFFYPNATMEDVIESCIPHVVPDVFPDEAAARTAMNQHFPTLKCWKKD